MYEGPPAALAAAEDSDLGAVVVVDDGVASRLQHEAQRVEPDPAAYPVYIGLVVATASGDRPSDSAS
jgi:hypothetical protein